MPKHQPDPDAEALREIVNALIDGGGRGQLTNIGKAIGMSAASLQKRLKRPGAGFDGPTLLTLLHVQNTRASDTESLTEEKTCGDYRIGLRADGTTGWRPAK